MENGEFDRFFDNHIHVETDITRDSYSNMSVNKAEKGFTLIELLVVISIIALLMSIMMPALGMVKRQAQATICQSTLKQWSICYEVYAGDNNDRLPPDWLLDLYRCYKEEKLLLCPCARKKGNIPGSTDENDGSRRGGKLHAWYDVAVEFPVNIPGKDETIEKDILGSYGCNAHVGGTGCAQTSPETDWLTVHHKGINNAPVLLDCAREGGVPLPEDDPPEYDGEIYYSQPMDIHEMRGFSLNRHPAYTVNSLFLDWSVRKVTIKELWTLDWYRGWPYHRGEYQELPDWPQWMNPIPNP